MKENETKTTATNVAEEQATESEALSEIEILNQENQTLKAQVEEFKDKWMRNVAEFDNYKKRNAKLWQDAFTEGKAEVLLKILPIGDHLDMAIAMGLDEKTAEGLKLLKRKFNETLETLEVFEINPEGEKFDPLIAEAIMQVEPCEGEESETVKQVFQKGYKIKDKIIRYAKVSVIK
ncbi:MAG: nucleotide exchange factor GrpE [Clostridiales bacterium]|nr:nucleotide exchange factor GrpE [Clostridiales bacterium]